MILFTCKVSEHCDNWEKYKIISHFLSGILLILFTYQIYIYIYITNSHLFIFLGIIFQVVFLEPAEARAAFRGLLYKRYK